MISEDKHLVNQNFCYCYTSLIPTKYYSSLFRKKRFMLDEMTWRNASKIVMFYMYKTPKLLFPFFISCYFIFSLMNALVYVDIDQGIHQGKK